MYTQNLEEEVIVNYFNGRTGALLDVGANDGKTYSNSLRLIELGWGGVLIEPSDKVFPKLCTLHEDNTNVFLVNAAIGNHVGRAKLYDSGDFLIRGTCSLLSTLKKDEIKRWGDVEFEEVDVQVITFEKMMEACPYKKFNFISIDCEGYDLEVLRQIDLDAVGCEMVCIEHNSFPVILHQMRSHLYERGFKEIGFNQENIICAK